MPDASHFKLHRLLVVVFIFYIFHANHSLQEPYLYTNSSEYKNTTYLKINSQKHVFFLYQKATHIDNINLYIKGCLKTLWPLRKKKSFAIIR